MKQHTLLIAFLVGTLVVSTAFADVYMHNMRGSNDRNCERNVNRNNGNRLFDSQNNAKGGYACPRAVGGQAAAAAHSLGTPLSTIKIISQDLLVQFNND